MLWDQLFMITTTYGIGGKLLLGLHNERSSFGVLKIREYQKSSDNF